MFFTHDRSFEEFFCICIQLLNKTWKEMRATSEDFNKVRHLGVFPGSSFLSELSGGFVTCTWDEGGPSNPNVGPPLTVGEVKRREAAAADS